MGKGNNSNQKLMELIAEMQPIEFAGLARLFNVSIVQKKQDVDDAAELKDQYEPRSFADVLGDVMSHFSKMNRERKREILKLVKKSNAAHRGERDASNTENLEAADRE